MAEQRARLEPRVVKADRRHRELLGTVPALRVRGGQAGRDRRRPSSALKDNASRSVRGW